MEYGVAKEHMCVCFGLVAGQVARHKVDVWCPLEIGTRAPKHVGRAVHACDACRGKGVVQHFCAVAWAAAQIVHARLGARDVGNNLADEVVDGTRTIIVELEVLGCGPVFLALVVAVADVLCSGHFETSCGVEAAYLLRLL